MTININALIESESRDEVAAELADSIVASGVRTTHVAWNNIMVGYLHHFADDGWCGLMPEFGVLLNGDIGIDRTKTITILEDTRTLYYTKPITPNMLIKSIILNAVKAFTVGDDND